MSEKRDVFDVRVSETRPKRLRERLFYGKNALNLRPIFSKRHPWAAVLLIIVIFVGAYWVVRQASIKAEVSDFSPGACLGSWQQVSNAQGSPDTLGGAQAFGENNAAIFDTATSATSSQIFCGGFLPPDYVPQGDIKNIGLTLVWQVGDVPLPTSSPVILPTQDASSSNDSSSTSLAPWFITRAFAQSDSSGDAGNVPADTNASGDARSGATSPVDPSTPTDSTASDTTTTIQLGPPIVAPLTPTSTSPVSSTDENADASSTADTSSSTTLIAPPAIDNNFLSVSYSVDGQTWIELAKVNPDNWQNFTATLPLGSWSDLKNLQVKIESVQTNLAQIPKVYLDGMFAEVHYEIPPTIALIPGITAPTSSPNPIAQPSAPLPPQTPLIMVPGDHAPVPTNPHGNFNASQMPAFNLDLNGLPAPTSTGAGTTGAGTPDTSQTLTAPDTPTPTPTPAPAPKLPPAVPDNSSDASTSTSFLAPAHRLLSFFFKTTGLDRLIARAQDILPSGLPTNENPVVVQTFGPNGNLTNLQPIILTNGNFLHIALPSPGRNFKPGNYHMKLWFWRNGAVYFTESDFSWGVLVVNFNKTIYTTGDAAQIGFGLLTPQGRTVCNGDIVMDVTTPSGKIAHFSTTNKTIARNATCAPQSVTNNPDYSARMKVGEAGSYSVSVTATGASDNPISTSDSFAAQAAPSFDVERTFPTRIFPPATYTGTIKIIPSEDYSGTVTESAPAVFQIVPQQFGTIVISGDTETIAWNVALKKGKETDLKYTFLAPDVSPQLYKIGPLQIGSWQELREWQIAADQPLVQIRQEINILDSPLTTGTSSEQVLLDATAYDGTSSSTAYYFEVLASVTSGSATTSLNELGVSTNDAQITVTSTVPKLYRVSFTPPANVSTSYDVTVVGGPGPSIKAARIIVLQGAAPITDTETQIEIGDHDTGNTNIATSSGALTNPKYWYYNAPKWNGTITGFAEVTYDIPSVSTIVASSVSFTTVGNATWTVPSTISPATATIRLWGGGGSGGGSNASPGAGSGAAGGSFVQLNSTSVTAGSQYSLRVAATTVGVNGASGTVGASSTFNNGVATANGGAAGLVDSTVAVTATTTGSVGDTKNAGGGGAAGILASQGGGGGGGAGTTGVGGTTATTTAGTGTSIGGGNGGTGATGAANGGNASTTNYGGGGGGAHSSAASNFTGGTGQQGRVDILYNVSVAATSSATFVLQKATGSFVWTDDTIIVNAGTATTGTRVRASFTPTAGNYYRIVGMTASSSVPYDIYNAKIVIDQTGNQLTNFEPQYLLSNTVANGTTSNQNALTSFNPGEWALISNTYVHQVDASTTATSTINLLNITASTTLNTITAATTTATSSIASMPAVTSTIDFQISKGTSTVYSDRILVDAAVNSSPSVSAVKINGGSSTIVLTPNATTSVVVSFTVTENNNGTCSNVFSSGNVTTTFYRQGLGSSCSANFQNCYIATLSQTTNGCGGSSATSANATATFGVYYYAQSTGNTSSSFPADHWIATVQAFDGVSNSASSSNSSTTDMGVLTAIGISTSTIGYGTVLPGTNTGSTNQLVTASNAGNSSTTLQLSGTALTNGGNSIATSSEHYATSTFTFGGNEQALSGSVTTVPGFVAISPITINPFNQVWTSTQAMPYADALLSSVAYNGYLYAIGGNAGGLTSTVIFSQINSTGSLGAWSSTQALPYTNDLFSSVAYNGYLYAIGGNASGTITSTVIFSQINSTGSLGTWTKTQALPTSTSEHASAVYNGYVYVMGGCGATCLNITSTVLFAPINSTGSIGAWSQTQALPVSDYQLAGAAYNGYLYAIGGNAGGALTSTVFFAPINSTGSIGAWSTTQALPYPDSFLGVAAYNGNLYALGGSITLGGALTSTVSFAPINSTGSLGAWSSTQALPYSDNEQGAALYNGYLYNVAGNASSGITSTVSYAALAAHDTYWGISVPNGSTAGTYTGTLTFTAVYSP